MQEKLERRQSLQTIAWFNDLYKRELLNLDPPYQRRSVWNTTFRQYFIETVLLHYPAPAIFLYEDIGADGSALYSVVDGKQRLTTIFEFAGGDFPVADDSVLERYQGKYFSQLDDQVKKDFWTYQFLVEYVPTTDQVTLNNVFERINKNVARLTRQELRHAKFGGRFAQAADEMAQLLEWRKARLAAQLKAGVEQIELIIAGFQANLDFVAQSSYPETDAKQQIIDVFQEMMTDETVSSALAPQSWSRFADNVYRLISLSLRGNTSYRMTEILAEMKRDLVENGAASGIMSGSLFQVVLGCVARGVAKGVSLKNFPVIDSPELRDFYRVKKNSGVVCFRLVSNLNIEPYVTLTPRLLGCCPVRRAGSARQGRTPGAQRIRTGAAQRRRLIN